MRVSIFYTVFLSMFMFCGGIPCKNIYPVFLSVFRYNLPVMYGCGHGVMEFTNVLSAAVIFLVVLQDCVCTVMAPVENENFILPSKAEKRSFEVTV